MTMQYLMIYLESWLNNMILGFDIDNVIADLDKTLLEEFLKEDKNKRNSGIINKNAEHMTQGMFDWSNEEIKDFLDKNMQRITENLEVVRDARKYLNKLQMEGHKIYLITGRNSNRLSDPEGLTKKWLLENKIYYDKLILTKNSKDKSKECLDNKVDVMFDDRPINIIFLRNKGINGYLFKTRYNYKYSLGLPIVNNWKCLYNLIQEMIKS